MLGCGVRDVVAVIVVEGNNLYTPQSPRDLASDSPFLHGGRWHKITHDALGVLCVHDAPCCRVQRIGLT